MGTEIPLTWSVVIPVKVLARAKSRLSGLADADREALVLAMATDTAVAAMACPAVGLVVVVSDDREVRAQAQALGAEVVPDQPAGGLNEALRFGAGYAAERWPGRGLAALTADLPALAPAELAVALSAACSAGQAFMADASGSGTTLYTARQGRHFSPRFGARSRQRHRQAGAVELELPGLAGLRQDVDRIDDLRRAAELGLGRHSAELARRLLAVQWPADR